MPSVSSLLVSASFVLGTNANFLQGKSRVETLAATAKEIEEMLISELEGQRDAAHLQGIKRDLAPMFEALPKSSDGRLDSATVRYALHRYFSNKHAWHIAGLDPQNGHRVSAMEGLAPGHLFKLFNHRLDGNDMGLHELAIFAATLKDLIHAEVSDQLLRSFEKLDVSTQGAITEKEIAMTTLIWLMQYVLGMDLDLSGGQDEMEYLRSVVDEIYPSMQDTVLWVEDIHHSMQHHDASFRNPFVEHRRTHADVEAHVKEIAHRFGQFQDLDCRRYKSLLIDIEEHGTGRVPLSQFYKGGLDGEWHFTESVGYLRSLGVLDETNPNRPSVMIANYVNSHSNCLEASSFYSVCCVDECEALLGHVEAEIAAPQATPARLASVIAALPSDTVDAPRNLSTSLLRRLDEVAEAHNGMVLLHSRLFAQWMHYAYPRECPFPHLSGTVVQVSPVKYAEAMGEDNLDISEAEMKQRVNAHVDIAAEEAVSMALWSDKEELLAGHMHWNAATDAPRGMASSLLRFAAAVVALLGFAKPLLSAAGRLRKETSWASDTSDKHFV